MGRCLPSEIDSLGGMEELHPQDIIQIVDDTGDTVNNEDRIGGAVFDFTGNGKVVRRDGIAEMADFCIQRGRTILENTQTIG